MANKNACPVCGQIDQAQNVPAILIQGTSSGVYAGPTSGLTMSGGKLGTSFGTAFVAGTSRTELARVLTPRAKPKEEKIQSAPAILLVIVGSILITVGSCSMGNSNGPGGVLLALGFILAVIGLGIGYTEQSSKKDEYQKRNAEALAAWEKEMEIYNRLYYCFRDNICYDPETGEFRPLMQTWQLMQK